MNMTLIIMDPIPQIKAALQKAVFESMSKVMGSLPISKISWDMVMAAVSNKKKESGDD